MPHHRLSKAILSQVGQFVQTLGEACPKPSRKFLYGMTLGLAMSGNVKLSEVARKLKPLKNIRFHALHKGLCRGLKSKQWSALPVQESYLGRAADIVPSNRFIACDLGDITKPSARKMPGLRTVRDGSTGKLKKGWWLVEIEAIFGKGKHLPLWLELFSVSRKGYKSQRTMVEAAISTIIRFIGTSGLWLFDRGFDNWEFFAFLERIKLDFLVRVKANRRVRDLSDNQLKGLGQVAKGATPTARFVWGRRHHRTGYIISVAFARIRILQSEQVLSLVVAHGFGRHPLLLFTNRKVADGFQAVKLVRAYLKRWGVEEAGRIQKQAFNLEDLRVLTWAGLVKLVWLAMWTYGLLCSMRLKANRLYEKILAAYPAFGPVPRFPYYRVAGGLALLLFVGALIDPDALLALWKSG
jgi:hypothetical protein